MVNNDTTSKTGESTNGNAKRKVANRATSPITVTRRGMMKATAGASIAALGMSTISGSVAGGLTEFDNLTVNGDNMIVNESDETFKIRGLNIPDPKRMHRTRFLRGKTAIQLVDMLTNNEQGWHPRAIRVPAQPQDIGEHPMGHTGPEYESGELENPGPVADDRRKMRPSQPPAFTRSELESYLEDYYDDVVDRCEERGVYCIIDYHRHWHEQPPGEEEPSYAENHLPYDSEYTNYWAYNSHDDFGTSVPGSWGYVDQITINELTPDYDGWAGIESESDIPGTPYAYENWTVNQELLDEVLMFWEVVGDRYGDRDHVLFEPYNEPTSPGIWGPVNGCGAVKQEPLWETFVYDFMGPILDEIRNHQPERVLLTGVPGWCQSVQALHWENFNEAGWDNIAVTWHNYAGHDVSQVHNWMNDTSYQNIDDIESATGEELTDPYLPVQTSLGDGETEDCYGWQAYEAAGLQNAMDHHPVVVSEFGWINDPDVVHWLRGTTTGQGTLNEYGVPFFEEMESDDRISWIGWCADARWLPKMFEYPDGPGEGDLDGVLQNDNFYDTPMGDLPEPCPDVENQPCEWNLLGGEDSGEYIKDRLAEYATHRVPFETETLGEGEGGTENGELVYDIDGNGETTPSDVTEFFDGFQDEYSDPGSYDFDGNGDVTTADVVELFENL